jgi:hypothetical protein
VDVGLIGEVAVWRAANGTDPTTADPADPHNYRLFARSGSGTSTGECNTATRRLIAASTRKELHLRPSKVSGRKIDTTRPQLSKIYRRPLPGRPSL